MCPEVGKRDNVPEDSPPVTTSCIANQSSVSEVFLQTIKVKIVHGNNKVVVRAVIDTGSQKSYITKAMCDIIGYEPSGEQLMVHSLFGEKSSGTVFHKKYRVCLNSLDDSHSFIFDALDQKIICNDVPSVSSGVWLKELKNLNINITDVNSKDQSVAVLIGADVAGRLLTGRLHNLQSGLVAVETLLGWTLMGEIPGNKSESKDAVLIARTLFVNNNDVSNLWSLDILGIKDPIDIKTKNQNDHEVTENLLKTLKVNEENRYEVQLPWIPNHPELRDNKEMAIRRLQSTVKNLKREGFYDDYDAVLKEWIKEDIIEYVPEEEEEQWGRYLPHLHVFKEGSTTSLRPVFDASAADISSPSLNECLEKGPNLIEMVTSILLKFRGGKYAVDNCIATVSSISELNDFVNDSRMAMLEAGFDLRGWEYKDDGLPNDQVAVLGLTSLAMQILLKGKLCQWLIEYLTR